VDLFTAAVGQSVPLDSVQEFRVLTNNYTAEYGRAAAGVINVTTKSGTNNYHGSVYEFNRVAALASQTYEINAQNFVNRQQGLPETPKPGFTRNQFGYSVGGPILPKIKDKMFFFSSTEWTRVRSNTTLFAFVPTPQFLAITAPNTQSFFNTFGSTLNATP